MNKEIQKGKNPTSTSENPGAEAEYCAWSLYTTTPRGLADHLHHPSQPNQWPCHPYLIEGNSSRLPWHREWAGKPVSCFQSLMLQQESQWSLAKFLIWHRINFYRWKNQRTEYVTELASQSFIVALGLLHQVFIKLYNRLAEGRKDL